MNIPHTPKEAILANVEYRPDFDPEPFRWSPLGGFLARQTNGVVSLLGFVGNVVEAPGSTEDHIVPVTEFAELPPELQTLDTQGKGVGLRAYNTAEGTKSLKALPRTVGLVAVQFEPAQYLDHRFTQGSRVSQVAEHFRRLVAGIFLGPERVVERVHAGYRDAQVVQLNTPPRALGRMAARKLVLPPKVTSSFVLVRDPGIQIERVGDVRSQ